MLNTKTLADLKLAAETFQIFYSHLGNQVKTYRIYLGSVVLTAIFGSILKPLFFKNLIDDLIAGDSLNSAFTEFLIAYAIISFFFILFRYISDYCIATCLPYVINNLERVCFNAIHAKSYDFFANEFSGALVTKQRRFIDGFINLDGRLTRNLLDTFIVFSFSLIVLGYYSPELFILFLIWSILFFFVVIILLPKKMDYDIQTSAASSRVTGQLADSATNFLNVKVFGSTKKERTRLNKFLDDIADKYKLSWLYTGNMIFLHLIVILIAELVIFYFGFKLYTDKKISLGLLVLLFTYLIQISRLLFEFGSEIKYIVRSLTGAQEMTEIILESKDRDPAIFDQEDFHLNTTSGLSIRFQNVYFSYDSSKELFNNLSFNILPFQKVGLVGLSGGGKSTIIKILLKLIEPQKGEVLLNDYTLSKISRKNLSKLISYVPQEPQMFHRTIFENITYGTEVTNLALVEEAAKKAYINEMIENLPEKYNTMVGERGIKLSTGEKQRLTIARAFLRNNSIILLDEPTSALDSESEFYIQKSLKDLFKNKTVIVIAHRLATVKMLDQIMVVENGKIVETGKHEDLIEQGKIYQKLWEYQTI